MVKSWASLIDQNTIEQAKMTARVPVVKGHVALMPDAHLGVGAAVGSVLITKNAIIPAAVGVDIGCGMIAVQTTLERGALSPEQCKRVLGRWREAIPAGVGKANGRTAKEWQAFADSLDLPVLDAKMQERAALQFGTLGAGNHFAEVSEDEAGIIWLVVHSGSRGVGNALANQHIRTAKEFCRKRGIKVEHPDLSFLMADTTEFDTYIMDMLWAQRYAYHQRETMMHRMLESLREAGSFTELSWINCHHNYCEAPESGDEWLTRKGAINASLHVSGVIPGSMGASTFIVVGLGNEEAYWSAPHGAGRLLARGAAKRTLDVEEFRIAMGERLWDDYNAASLLDEAPMAYKPIEIVMEDAKDLVRAEHKLSQFINYKGL